MAIRKKFRFNFMHRHMKYTVVILEDINQTYPHCARCENVVLWESLNFQHPNTFLCIKGEEGKQFCLATEEAQEVTETAFWAYSCTLNNMAPFKYLGHLLETTYD